MMHSEYFSPAGDQLLGKLIGLARPTDGNEHLITPESTCVIVEGLLAIRSGQVEDPFVLAELLRSIEHQKRNMVPDCFVCACPCGKNDDYSMAHFHSAASEIRTLKTQILERLLALAPAVGQNLILYQALISLGMEDGSVLEQVLSQLPNP